MTATTDIGTRLELVPMDGHFHDITVALYRQRQADGGPAFRVHSYSRRDGVGDRLERIRAALEILAGLQPVAGGRLAFPCGQVHDLAARRAFLEACKLGPAADLAPQALRTVDRKSGLTVAVEPVGHGQYRVGAVGPDIAEVGRRLGVIVNGLLKLGDMRRVAGAEDCVAFPCGQPHDELVGLLLQRAPNVRALVREQEAMAARGVLSAPSARQE